MKKFGRTTLKASSGAGTSFLGLVLLIEMIATSTGVELGNNAYLLAIAVALVIGVVVWAVPNVNTPGELISKAAKEVGYPITPEQADAAIHEILQDIAERNAGDG